MDKMKHSTPGGPAPDPAAGVSILTTSATPSEASLGVYVHFPWCLAKCPYCDFLSVGTDPARIPHRAYADAVLAELDRRVQPYGNASGRLRSVFFGGGTPSLWEPRELGRVLERIQRAFSHQEESLEVTIECNPSSFDAARARDWRDLGVSRVSLGIQGLDDERLRFLGRLHDADAGLAALDGALRTGFARVSADLIFGVAGQRPEEAAREADLLAARGLTHLSAYALTVEPGTAFGARARIGRLPLLDEAAVADSFVAVSETLGGHGFEHYEVSNYARLDHRALHNLGYWRGEDYLGLGCGAWGTVRMGPEAVRYRNTPIPDRYLELRDTWPDTPLDAPGALVQNVEPLDGATRLRERLMLGLRTVDGVDLDNAAAELGVPAWTPRRQRATRRWLERGGLVRDGGRLRIPRDRWLLADGIIADVM
jgi:putative oxygen-independent coproporphyrinogen III oxidase